MEVTVHGTHAPALVALSILIAIVASYAALDLGGRIRAGAGRAQYAWLLTAAIAMGGGIWSMHFVAMLAFHLPGVPVSYHWGVTLLSLFCAIAVTGIGFFAARGREVSALLASGVFMGFGIVSMHYIGMAAMVMPARLWHAPTYVTLSVLIAVGAACIAIRLAFSETDFRQKIIAALFMGVAISGMHYTAMHGTNFQIGGDIHPEAPTAGLDQVYLAVSVSAVTFSILILALVAAAQDRGNVARAHRDAERESFKKVVEASPSGILVVNGDGIITLVNAQLEAQFGYGRNELIGQPVEQLIPGHLGAKHVGLRRAYSRAPTTRMMGVGRDLHGLRKDGSEFPVEIGLNAIDAETTLATIVDITERKKAEHRQELLTREIFHRTRNLLAIVQAIASRSMLGHRSADEERAIFLSRLASLSRSDRRLVEADDEGVALIELMVDETEGFSGQIKLDIDRGIRLPANQTRDFALIVHELVTNAAKYGALKTKDGSVRVTARREGGANGNTRIRFSWEERGGPPVKKPTSQGFGLSLFDMVARGMAGKATTHFDPAGLRCEMVAEIESERRAPSISPID
jgi:PAS domain S-box-containing protein